MSSPDPAAALSPAAPSIPSVSEAAQLAARRALKLHRRKDLHMPANLGERLADAVASGMGSWRFIIIQSAFVACWMLLNTMVLVAHWDPYPWILLNLLFSTQAAYAAPIIMMSQNRQSAKDRVRDDHEADEVSLLYAINQQQLEMLRNQQEEIVLLRQMLSEQHAA